MNHAVTNTKVFRMRQMGLFIPCSSILGVLYCFDLQGTNLIPAKLSRLRMISDRIAMCCLQGTSGGSNCCAGQLYLQTLFQAFFYRQNRIGYCFNIVDLSIHHRPGLMFDHFHIQHFVAVSTLLHNQAENLSCSDIQGKYLVIVQNDSPKQLISF